MTPSLAVLSVLSDDLIAEVLSFLPVRSLLRFRCVSKSWKTLISDLTFMKLHLEKSQSQTRNSLFTIIMMRVNHIPGSDNEYEEVYSVIPYHIHHLFENASFTLFDNPCYYHLKTKVSERDSPIVGSIHGLILFANLYDKFEYEEYWLHVWNPATRTITENFGYLLDHINVTFHFTFGYDNSTCIYKVMAFRSCYISDQWTTDVRVLNLGSDDVWRNIESFPVVPFRSDFGGYKYVYVSGALNWLAIHNNNYWYDFKDITVEQFVIVSLDLETETYNQYMVPRGFDEVPPKEPTIGVLRGCLCFSYSYKETDFVIWEMKEFGVEDSWTQFLKISYHNLLIDYDFSDPRIKFDFQLVPLFLSEDGNTLILESNQESQTILYNRRDNRVERTEIIASNTTSDHVYVDYANDYVQSLVPIF